MNLPRKVRMSRNSEDLILGMGEVLPLPAASDQVREKFTPLLGWYQGLLKRRGMATAAKSYGLNYMLYIQAPYFP